MKYLLDTNICIYIINRKQSEVVRKFKVHSLGDIGISTVTLAELEYGAAKSAYPEKNKLALLRFVAPLDIRQFTVDAASVYGSIRSHLEKKGKPIGAYDLMIAAQAIADGATLVTNNFKEFSRVPDLHYENWL